LFFGCLTLWIGCKARLDARSCARDGESCCVALGLGSDSARVNEVAKLCRAVVPVMEGGFAPKAGLLVLAKSWCRMVGWTSSMQKTRAAGWFVRRTGRSQDWPFKNGRS